MFTQAAHAGGATRGYGCFLCTEGQHLCDGQWQVRLETKVLLLSTGKNLPVFQVKRKRSLQADGDQNLGRSRQENSQGWENLGLNWRSSQKERRCKRVADHLSDSVTSTETIFAEQRRCHENTLCGSRMGSQGFSCQWGALAGWAVSLTTLGPRGSHRHGWEPGPPKKGGAGKTTGELTIYPHLWGRAVWHTNIVCLRSGS